MLSTLLTVLPIFALILAGWGARKIGVLGLHATTQLNRFVVYLALPALLFDIVANARWTDIWQPGFMAAFGLSCLIVFFLTVAVGLRGPRPLADAAVDGLNASYPNTGFMGFPIALAVFGEASLPLSVIAAIITVCVVFALGIVLIEIGLQADSDVRRLFAKVTASLLRNPLIMAPLLAAFFPILGWAVPAPATSFFRLLGASASPCALVALGLFLAESRNSAQRLAGPTLMLTVAKLAVQPAIAWAIAVALHLPPLTKHMAVLIAALPTGTGPFMLAELYEREAGVTSSTILVTTLVSVFTIALYLHWMGA